MGSVKIEEHILRYRQMAQDALALASTSSDRNVHASYLVMASDWHALAADLEHDLKGEAEDRSPTDQPQSGAGGNQKSQSRTDRTDRHRR